MCSFCVLCLASTMTDQMQLMYESPCCCCRFLLFIIIIIIILILISSKRTKKNERFFRFLFIQTNSVDSFSITNIFYHLICHLVCHIICPNIYKEMSITIPKWKYKSKKEGDIHFVIRINTSKPDHSDQYQYRPSFLS